MSARPRAGIITTQSRYKNVTRGWASSNLSTISVAGHFQRRTEIEKLGYVCVLAHRQMPFYVVNLPPYFKSLTYGEKNDPLPVFLGRVSIVMLRKSGCTLDD
jgi:hypothetical protein